MKNLFGTIGLGAMLTVGSVQAAAENTPDTATPVVAASTAAKTEKLIAFPGVDMSRLSDDAKAAIGEYNKAEGTKVLVISADGIVAFATGADINVATAAAITACGTRTKESCRIVSVNGNTQKPSGDKVSHVPKPPVAVPPAAVPPTAEKPTGDKKTTPPTAAVPPTAEKPTGDKKNKKKA